MLFSVRAVQAQLLFKSFCVRVVPFPVERAVNCNAQVHFQFEHCEELYGSMKKMYNVSKYVFNGFSHKRYGKCVFMKSIGHDDQLAFCDPTSILQPKLSYGRSDMNTNLEILDPVYPTTTRCLQVKEATSSRLQPPEF